MEFRLPERSGDYEYSTSDAAVVRPSGAQLLGGTDYGFDD
jgi:hypothetical protein